MVAALVVGAAGHRRPAGPRLAGAARPAGLGGRSAAGACATRRPIPFVWVVTQLGGRVTILVVLAGAGRLPGLAHGAPGCRWCGCWSRLGLLTLAVYAIKTGIGRTAPGYPGRLLLPRRRRVLPLRARRQRRADVGYRPVAGGRVRTARPACSALFWALGVVGPVAAGRRHGVAGLPLGHRRRGRRGVGRRPVGRGSRTRRSGSVTLGTCPSRPADRVAAAGASCWRRGQSSGAAPRPRLRPRGPPADRRGRPARRLAGPGRGQRARSPTPGCRSSPGWWSSATRCSP